MNYYRIEINEFGKQLSCVKIDSAPENHGATVIIVQADSVEKAKKRASNIYCARKKKLARQRNYLSGNCACGRANDRKDEIDTRTGLKLKMCSVCAARQTKYNVDHRLKVKIGAIANDRNEEQRLDANRERMRDRRSELRIETLIEVRKNWIKSNNVGAFSKWLESEIEKCLEPKLRIVGETATN